jgi:transcriptional regulator with XRE-family HTH domain
VNVRRLRALRLARGLTLDELSQAMGGLVTKQALSKYEAGSAVPSPRVLVALARALGVKSAELLAESRVEVQLLAFRKRASMTKSALRQLESAVAIDLENRVRLQELVGQVCTDNLPIGRLEVESVEAADDAAQHLRMAWHLGTDPIAHMTGVLEDHCVHVITVEAPEKFDGMAAIAESGERAFAAAVVTRRGIAGERQRLNLGHELGHLLLRPADDVDEEKAAFRFAAALLAPREAILSDVGPRRSEITRDELLLLKRTYGLSMQALVYRLHDLGVISDRYYQQWWKYINVMGWKRQEPEELPAEVPAWLEQSTLRALSEGLIGESEANRLLGRPVEMAGPISRRRALAGLSPDARRSSLQREARAAVQDYLPDELDDDGDLVDY